MLGFMMIFIGTVFTAIFCTTLMISYLEGKFTEKKLDASVMAILVVVSLLMCFGGAYRCDDNSYKEDCRQLAEEGAINHDRIQRSKQ